MKNIFLLPTDKSSNIYSYYGMLEDLSYGKTYTLANEEVAKINLHKDLKEYQEKLIEAGWSAESIYITNSEETKEGDWYCSPNGIVFKMYEGEKLPNDWKKIILTTDTDLIADGIQPIDDEFLEWFVKNPSCDNVEVESINIGGKLGYLICKPKEVPKFENSIENSIGIISIVNYMFGKKEGTLNLKNLEEKLDTALSKETSESLTNWLQNKRDNQKTLEEAAESKYGIGYGAVDSINAFIEGAKWQAGKMYSEKEVYKILLDYQSNYPYANNEIGLKKWFKQFKKK